MALHPIFQAICEAHGLTPAKRPIKCDACSAEVGPDEADDLRCPESGDVICQKCRDDEEAYWREVWECAPLSERNPEEYRRQMIEAGRGHLLPPQS